MVTNGGDVAAQLSGRSEPFEWGDIPEEFADRLFELLSSLVGGPGEELAVKDIREWLEKNAQKCEFTEPEGQCGEIAIPGLRVCPGHLNWPREKKVDGQ